MLSNEAFASIFNLNSSNNHQVFIFITPGNTKQGLRGPLMFKLSRSFLFATLLNTIGLSWVTSYKTIYIVSNQVRVLKKNSINQIRLKHFNCNLIMLTTYNLTKFNFYVKARKILNKIKFIIQARRVTNYALHFI